MLFFHDSDRLQLGLLDHLPDDRRPCRPDPAHLEADQVDAGHAARRAADQGAAGQVQGRQAASPAGDDEVLPGEQDQPVRILPAIGAADAGVHLALLHAAQGPAARHLPGHQSAHGGRTRSRCGSTEASQFFFIPDITDKATGGVLVALVVLYVGSQLLSSIFMTTTTDRNQRLIMMALPFVFVAFVINFPAGLLVYWITTNLWTVGPGPRRPAPGAESPRSPARLRGTAGLPSPARAAAAPERRRRPQDRDENGGSAEQKPAARRRGRHRRPRARRRNDRDGDADGGRRRHARPRRGPARARRGGARTERRPSRSSARATP